MKLILNFSLLITIIPAISVANFATTETASFVNNNSFSSTYEVEYETTITTAKTNNSNQRLNLSCTFAFGLTVGDRQRELACCDRIVELYHSSWLINNRPLNRYLENLKEWHCPQFKVECETKLFAYNRFTELMYEMFCNYEQFVESCYDNVTKVVAGMQRISEHERPEDSFTDTNVITSENVNGPLGVFHPQLNSSLITSWKKIVRKINPSQLTLEELLEPCIQVAQYDQEEVHNGVYQEIVEFGIPFCGITWCGFGGEATKSHDLSVWSCLNPECKVNVIIIMVVCGILGLAITAVNILIVLVISLNAHLRNSQAVYKVSLAVADFLVGTIVLPLCIVNLGRLVWTKIEIPDAETILGYDIYDNSSINIISVQYYKRAGTFITKYPREYQYFSGFVTAISIFVSVYTLAGAVFDRLKAISKPFDYRRDDAYKISIKACVGFWVLATVFGILPIFIKDIKYVLILSMIFATFEVSGYILYSITFFIPLLIVWIGNLMTFLATKRHRKFRRSMTARAQKRRQHVERRLAATLRLMVGVFTVSTLPLLLTILFSSFVPSLHPNLPKQFSVENTTVFLVIQFIALMLLFANSLWNFFIYSIRNREFRMALKELLQRFISKTALNHCINTASMCLEDVAHKSSLTSTNSSVRRKSTNATINTKMDGSCNSLDETHCCHTTVTVAACTPNLGKKMELERTPVRSCSDARHPDFHYHDCEILSVDSPFSSNTKMNCSNEVVHKTADEDVSRSNVVETTSV